MLQGPLKIGAHHTHVPLPRRGQRCLDRQGQDGRIAVCVAEAWQRRRKRSSEVPRETHSYSLHSDARQIIISPGSISTDRRATSSSSSDKGLWFADRPENSFQLRGVESLGGERERQLRGIRSGWVSRSTKSKEAKAYQLNQACSRGSTNCVQIQRAAGIKTDTQSQQQLTMRAMNRPKSCTAGIWVSGEQSAV